jgi:hypothetical protein
MVLELSHAGRAVMTEEVVIVETPRGDPVNHVEPGEPDGPEVGFWEVSGALSVDRFFPIHELTGAAVKTGPLHTEQDRF